LESSYASPDDDPVALRFRQAREAHDAARNDLTRILEELGLRARFVGLTDPVDASGYDLVLALGGDGTVLHASHQIGETPVLAINSAPDHSVGYLTAATIDTARDMIGQALSGDLPVTRLNRMAIDIEGRRGYSRVLNDVLFSHECPASTARYVIRTGDEEERQMSSGIWVSTAAGSTAAIRSAGGGVMPPNSRRLQFVVREAYRKDGSRFRLVKGFIAPGERLSVRSIIDSARLYIDGPHEMLPLKLGQTVEFYQSEEPLSLLAFRRNGKINEA
jgi:NAD+ kinase